MLGQKLDYVRLRNGLNCYLMMQLTSEAVRCEAKAWPGLLTNIRQSIKLKMKKSFIICYVWFTCTAVTLGV
jgi:hypothetical protein